MLFFYVNEVLHQTLTAAGSLMRLPGTFQRAGCRKCQNTCVVFDHPRVSYSLRPSSNSTRHGMNKGDIQRLHAARSRRKNATMLPASPKHASALPGDVSDDQMHTCTRSRRRPLPRSPIGILGEFQSWGSWEIGRYTGAAHIF